VFIWSEKVGKRPVLKKKVGRENGSKTPKKAYFEGKNGFFDGFWSCFMTLRPEGQKFFLLNAI